METIKIIPLPISPALKEKMERDQKHKEEASKSFGDYLVSITNMCFDKCINTDNIKMSKKEENCIDEFFHKFSEAHQYAVNKFQSINKFTEMNRLERSKDYGDYFGLLEWFYGEDLEKIGLYKH